MGENSLANNLVEPISEVYFVEQIPVTEEDKVIFWEFTDGRLRVHWDAPKIVLGKEYTQVFWIKWKNLDDKNVAYRSLMQGKYEDGGDFNECVQNVEQKFTFWSSKDRVRRDAN